MLILLRIVGDIYEAKNGEFNEDTVFPLHPKFLEKKNDTQVKWGASPNYMQVIFQEKYKTREIESFIYFRINDIFY